MPAGERLHSWDESPHKRSHVQRRVDVGHELARHTDRVRPEGFAARLQLRPAVEPHIDDIDVVPRFEKGRAHAFESQRLDAQHVCETEIRALGRLDQKDFHGRHLRPGRFA